MTPRVPPDLNQRGVGPIQRYATERAEGSPTPPRDVPLVDVARLSYGSTAMRVAAGVAVVLGFAVIAMAIALWQVALDPLLLLVLGLLFGVGIPLVPLLAGLRARRAIRDGTLVQAEVVEITERVQRGSGEDAPTRVVGVATHEIADGPTRLRFDVEAPWAADLEEGSVIVGLVPPTDVPLWLGTTAPPPGTPPSD